MLRFQVTRDDGEQFILATYPIDKQSGFFSLTDVEGMELTAGEAMFDIASKVHPIGVGEDRKETTFTLDNGSTIQWVYNRNSPGSEHIGTGFTLYLANGTRVATLASTHYYSWLCLFGTYPKTSPIEEATAFVRIEKTISSATGNYYYPFEKWTGYNLQNFIKFFEGVEDIGNDPYRNGGTSSTGGGTGTFSDTGDSITVPELPTLSAVDAGFITLFTPTATQMKTLATYLWAGAFDLASWKKIFADPMDAILGLSIVPVVVPSSGSAAVSVGNISTGVYMDVANTQYVSVDCGTLTVPEYWGSFLDYSPYTKLELYLPYCGTHQINADEVIGKSISIVYHVDILSGACVAMVSCGGSVLYSFGGQCSSSIPITGQDWTNVINGVISGTAGAVATIASGGAIGVGSAVSGAAQLVTGIKPNVQKSGGVSSTAAMLGVQTPYLILNRPRQCVPKYQNELIGYPSYIYDKLNNVSGFTRVAEIHLEEFTGTEAERDETENLLKTGVIL